MKEIAHNSGLGKLKTRPIFPVRDFGQESDDLILATSNGGLMHWDGQTSTPLNSSLDSFTVFNGTMSPSGKILLGSNGNGVLTVGETGELLSVLNESRGLQQEQVVFPYVDREAAVWCPLFKGLSRVYCPEIAVQIICVIEGGDTKEAQYRPYRLMPKDCIIGHP